MTDACPHCGTTYADLLRNARRHLFLCRECEQVFCESCVILDYSFGHDIAAASCPNCASDQIDLIDLPTRFSIYSKIEDIARIQNGLALPFVPWSVYPRRTEQLVRKALPKLQRYRPDFVLLNEDDESTRNVLAVLFPDCFQAMAAIGAGSLIWIKGGEPVDCSQGGPYVTEYEILVKSRAAWS
jgi:hypothetical protein